MFRYRPPVLAELLRHGVRPTDRTPPALVRAYLNDLYRHELRRLRSALLAGRIPKPQYSSRVVELRQRYPLLSLPERFWVEE
ncbi:MAG: hypothetical protein EHM13_08430 [Acidobacteria bacterium]|nr:MAG: hypothetical protein EHM13_08430 [Acidobacteriota bacterium]